MHIRINVFQQGLNEHPIAADHEIYINMIRDVIKKYNYKRIYIASLEQEAIAKFCDEFGEDKIIYYDDVKRNLLGEPDYNANENYEDAYQVLRDVYTLARCDGFIAGLSNVSLGVQIVRKSIEEKDFEYKHIFDLGICSSNYGYEDFYKANKVNREVF